MQFNKNHPIIPFQHLKLFLNPCIMEKCNINKFLFTNNFYNFPYPFQPSFIISSVSWKKKSRKKKYIFHQFTQVLHDLFHSITILCTKASLTANFKTLDHIPNLRWLTIKEVRNERTHLIFWLKILTTKGIGDIN